MFQAVKELKSNEIIFEGQFAFLTNEVISTFYCSKDCDVENFLKNENKAILEVLSDNKILITFKDGSEIEQELQ